MVTVGTISVGYGHIGHVVVGYSDLLTEIL